DADGPTDEGEQDRLREELCTDLRLGSAECTAQPDLGAPLEHADQHDVGDADSTDEERDGAKAEEEAVESTLGVGARGEGGGGLAHVDLVGRLGVRGRAENGLDGRSLARDASDVHGGRVAVEAEVA